MISSLPTIFHIKNGVWRDFGHGKRKKKDLQDFIKLKKWETIEPFYFLDPGKDVFRYRWNLKKLHVAALREDFMFKDYKKFVSELLKMSDMARKVKVRSS